MVQQGAVDRAGQAVGRKVETQGMVQGHPAMQKIH
jgi:hypothetical protein